jgi:hypothetical protein
MGKIQTGLTAIAIMAALVPSAYAQTKYAGETMGKKAHFSGNQCDRYKMTMSVDVAGSEVNGLFQQKDRPQRNFKAVADSKGAFRTKARVDGGEMDVKGQLKGDSADVTLDGYCVFTFALKKQ